MATVPFSDTAAAGQAKNPACAAFACAVLGFQVFPLLPGAGTPAVKGWPEIATSNLEEVQYMWTGEFQDCGVGIATGEASNIWALDIDVKKGQNGFKTLQALCEAHGADARAFASTMAVSSPSGGCHLYFTWEPGIHNSTGGTNALGEGLDVRGIRGYVRAPGWSGRQVVPRNGVRHVDIMQAPDWLVTLAKTKPSRPPKDENDSNGGPGVLGKERTLDLLGAAPRGTRNNALNQASFRLALRGEMTRDEAWAECKLVMYSIGASDTEAEQLRTFESGWRSGLAKRHGSMNTQLPSAAGPSATTEG
jgi:hypothetical protein